MKFHKEWLKAWRSNPQTFRVAGDAANHCVTNCAENAINGLPDGAVGKMQKDVNRNQTQLCACAELQQAPADPV